MLLRAVPAAEHHLRDVQGVDHAVFFQFHPPADIFRVVHHDRPGFAFRSSRHLGLFRESTHAERGGDKRPELRSHVARPHRLVRERARRQQREIAELLPSRRDLTRHRRRRGVARGQERRRRGFDRRRGGDLPSLPPQRRDVARAVVRTQHRGVAVSHGRRRGVLVARVLRDEFQQSDSAGCGHGEGDARATAAAAAAAAAARFPRLIQPRVRLERVLASLRDVLIYRIYPRRPRGRVPPRVFPLARARGRARVPAPRARRAHEVRAERLRERHDEPLHARGVERVLLVRDLHEPDERVLGDEPDAARHDRDLHAYRATHRDDRSPVARGDAALAVPRVSRGRDERGAGARRLRFHGQDERLEPQDERALRVRRGRAGGVARPELRSHRGEDVGGVRGVVVDVHPLAAFHPGRARRRRRVREHADAARARGRREEVGVTVHERDDWARALVDVTGSGEVASVDRELRERVRFPPRERVHRSPRGPSAMKVNDVRVRRTRA
eukprot:31176-Pelagococcus_subviridis.AAC.10